MAVSLAGQAFGVILRPFGVLPEESGIEKGEGRECGGEAECQDV